MGFGYNIFTYNWISAQLRPHYRYLHKKEDFKKMITKKLISKLAIAGALLGGTTITLVNASETVYAGPLVPTARTKDYNKLQKLAKKSGAHYVKKKAYASWVPGNNVAGLYSFKTLKNNTALLDPGRQEALLVGAGTIKGRAYVIMHAYEDSKTLIPAEYFKLPYGMKFKKNHKTVYCYVGSLANAYNGYDEFHDDFGIDYTKVNTIYKNHGSKRALSMKVDGQNRGKYQGFFIGHSPILMNDGENYLPVYSYTVNGDLTVVYIKQSDLSQFKPAKVYYKQIGILNYHSFKPVSKNYRF